MNTTTTTSIGFPKKKSSVSVVIVSVVIVMVVINGAAAQECKKDGERCENSRCCDGLSCNRHFDYLNWIQFKSVCGKWCPSYGASCGLLDSCCPGLRCDGWFWGTCQVCRPHFNPCV
ncbi:unnamed protein product [Amaranthus hypochondriacus]